MPRGKRKSFIPSFFPLLSFPALIYFLPFQCFLLRLWPRGCAENVSFLLYPPNQVNFLLRWVVRLSSYSKQSMQKWNTKAPEPCEHQVTELRHRWFLSFICSYVCSVFAYRLYLDNVRGLCSFCRILSRRSRTPRLPVLRSHSEPLRGTASNADEIRHVIVAIPAQWCRTVHRMVEWAMVESWVSYEDSSSSPKDTFRIEL